jgi:hypothetical protein
VAPNFRIDAESTQVHVPTYLTCKFRADPELVLRCQNAGDTVHRGTRIGQLREFWPFDALKRQALEEAQTFIRYMRTQDYEPRQSHFEMELWGPFPEKVKYTDSLTNIEEGNPFFPDGRWVSNSRGTREATRGPQELDKETVLNSPDWKKGTVFLIRGQFIGNYGHVEEATGTLIV